MIQMMMASIGVPAAANAVQARRPAFRLRKAVGLAIVASGLAVLAAQAVQHALGG